MDDLTEEQITELQQKAAKVEELEKFKGESETKLKEYETTKAEWEAKEKEYQEQVNPNWQKARKSMETMKKALEEKGVKVDEDGNIVSNPNNIDIEKVRTEAREAARDELLGHRLEDMLSVYDVESAKVVKHYYEKLTAGETITLQNIGSFIQQAEQAARAGQDNEIKKIYTAYSAGTGPRPLGESENKLDDARAKELGKLMGLGFASDDK